MAKDITERTRLKRGDIVRYPAGDEFFVGIVARNENYLGKPGFIAFNTLGPGDRTFIKDNNGVDWYQRHHITDLVRKNAELIKPIELIVMYKDTLGLIRMLKSQKSAV